MTGPISRRHFLNQSSKILLTTGIAGTAGSALLTACGNTSSSGTVQITYNYPAFSGLPKAKDLQQVQDAMNEILRKQINATIKLTPIDGSTWEQKIKLALASGQVGDIVFTASWTNNYLQNVAQGNFRPLDDLLPKYAPGLYASLTRASWNAARVNGKIYAVINQQLFPKYWGFTVQKNLADKYGLDPKTIHSYADLEPFLARVKAGEPDIVPWYSNVNGAGFFLTEIYGWDALTNGAAVRYNDSSLKVFNAYATPEYRAIAVMAQRWHQRGYMTKDPRPSADADTAWRTGKIAAQMSQARPYSKDPNINFPVYQQTLVNPPLLTTESEVATLNAITRYSQHPAEAMQVLEQLNTNKQVYNLLCFGIEGKHYVFKDKAKGVVDIPPGMTAQTDPYYPNTDWLFGNVFNAYYRDADSAKVNLWDVEKKLNQQATPSAALGFSFDPTSVKTQVANVSAVVTQYDPQISNGLGDPNSLVPQFLSQLQTAGIDQIIAEVQRQITAWAAKK